MAVLKDLIVHGNSRFLNVAQFKDLIADTGRFQKLTTNVLGEEGQTISVYGIMNVEGELNTKSWTNANIATIGGNMYICPTIESATGTVTVGVNTLTFGGTFSLDNLLGGDSNTSSWTQNSLVLVTGEILYNNEYLPMGTLKGKIGSGVSTSSFPITNVTNNKSTGTTADIFNLIPAGSYTYRNLKISIYEVYTSSKLYPLGIYFTAMGSNGRTFIDIYGGNKDTGTATSGAGNLAEPNVRIGNLKGLPQIMSTYTPTGWGIYTNNGYFTGTVVAKQGKIGDPSALGQSGQLWTIGNDNATGNAMIYSGTTGIGKDTNIYISSGVSSAQNIADSGTSSKTWAYTAGTNFGVTTNGTLYAKNAQISGSVAATNGFTVTSAATNGVTLASMTANGITLGQTASNKFNILITDTAVSGKGPGILLRQGTNVLNEITANGMKLYLASDTTNSIAEFGDNLRIGKANGPAFHINTNNLTAYYVQDIDGEQIRTPYFQVGPNGMNYGDNIVASETYVSQNYYDKNGTDAAIAQEAELRQQNDNKKLDSSSTNSYGNASWADDGTLTISRYIPPATSSETGETYAIVVGAQGIEFKYQGEAAASINKDTLIIDKTVVLDEMQVGKNKWTWKIDSDPTDDTIYLKWIG